jgi:transposase-like protein
MATRKYTDEQRAEALALYAEVGPAKAARQLGIRAGTLRQWAVRAGVTGHDPRTRLATEAAKTKWAARRDDLANQAGAAAQIVLEAMVKAAQGGDGTTARGLSIAFGVTVDKAQLLSGGATSRDQIDVSTPEARLALVQDLTSRRPATPVEEGA